MQYIFRKPIKCNYDTIASDSLDKKYLGIEENLIISSVYFSPVNSTYGKTLMSSMTF